MPALVFLVELPLDLISFSPREEGSDHFKIGSELTNTLNAQQITNQLQVKGRDGNQCDLPRRNNQSPVQSKSKSVSSCAKMLN